MAYIDGSGNELVAGGVQPRRSDPAALTTGAGDNAVPFPTPVTSYLVQNNGPSPVYLMEDAAATPGAIAVPAGGVFQRDVPVAVLHVYAPAGLSINGAIAGGLVVRGTY